MSAGERSRCTWYRTACLYRDMASALKLVQGRAGGMPDPENIIRYWDTQGKLMTQIKSLGSPFEELEFCRDALSDLSFLCADLEGAGISVQDQKERVMDLIGAARKVSGLPAQHPGLY